MSNARSCGSGTGIGPAGAQRCGDATQQDIGEVCGLTSVHVNRTIRRLREDGLIEIAGRRARVLDAEALAKIGEFIPDYLYLEDEFHTP